MKQQIGIIDVQWTNLKQLCDPAMTTQTKYLQQVLQFMPQRIRVVLTAKRGSDLLLAGRE